MSTLVQVLVNPDKIPGVLNRIASRRPFNAVLNTGLYSPKSFATILVDPQEYVISEIRSDPNTQSNNKPFDICWECVCIPVFTGRPPILEERRVEDL